MKRVLYLFVLMSFLYPLGSHAVQKSNVPIIDLHCDMLDYLYLNSENSPKDPEARCSIEQMQSGGVALQVLPIWNDKYKDQAGIKQAEIFRSLLKNYSDVFIDYSHIDDFKNIAQTNKIIIMASIENAAVLCDEKEPFRKCKKNLDKIRKIMGPLVYVGLSWSDETRFGGGNNSPVGLTKDGEKLVKYLAKRHIPIDLSHASDQLAKDIIAYIEKHRLQVPLIASHSAFRGINDIKRNLPDFKAEAIINDGGIIGLVFLRPFVGKSTPYNFVKQMSYGLKLGAAKSIALGADFFNFYSLPKKYQKMGEDSFFFPQYANSGDYPRLLNLFKKNLKLSDDMTDALAYRNALTFIKECVLKGN
ncbi:MAG: membrane dipeptidase [Bacteroidia bacterium]|nr:membrane dipeptidase [Bacteroidia bacterium]